MALGDLRAGCQQYGDIGGIIPMIFIFNPTENWGLLSARFQEAPWSTKASKVFSIISVFGLASVFQH